MLGNTLKEGGANRMLPIFSKLALLLSTLLSTIYFYRSLVRNAIVITRNVSPMYDDDKSVFVFLMPIPIICSSQICHKMHLPSVSLEGKMWQTLSGILH